MLFRKQGDSLFVDLLCVLYEKIEDELLRHCIYEQMIEIIEDSKVIPSLSGLKGIDPVFDRAYALKDDNK
jgi:hypothetical protein